MTRGVRGGQKGPEKPVEGGRLDIKNWLSWGFVLGGDRGRWVGFSGLRRVGQGLSRSSQDEKGEN